MHQDRKLDRRSFLGLSAASAAAAAAGARLLPALPLAACAGGVRAAAAPGFSISLAEWSLHRALRGGGMSNLDFPQKARSFGIDAVEYVNQFFQDKAGDAAYLAELNRRCAGEGVQNVLIMCDGEGALGDPDAQKRAQAVQNHHKWADAAKVLGCHSIRVNAQSAGSWEEQQKLAADGLHRLAEYAEGIGIHVIVENHGGLSSNGKWLSGTLRLAGMPQVGALPDFGNFRVSKDEEYDRYLGVGELMPFARGVSAKTHDFDAAGEEVHTDYHRMLKIVCIEHGYRGRIGIEYEGDGLAEDDGIRATLALLLRVRGELAAAGR